MVVTKWHVWSLKLLGGGDWWYGGGGIIQCRNYEKHRSGGGGGGVRVSLNISLSEKGVTPFLQLLLGGSLSFQVWIDESYSLLQFLIPFH